MKNANNPKKTPSRLAISGRLPCQLTAARALNQIEISYTRQTAIKPIISGRQSLHPVLTRRLSLLRNNINNLLQTAPLTISTPSSNSSPPDGDDSR
ncbi:hypothetical protein G7K_0790-t1 [Saitoella complicata NRRL Y-17804]|uniref:Uncharacterized protein n=1 Tax=Saitoella complicata (strain BCRC 22490 / CBS 7301 / JCM 7358 / NBRC 10748 / NRRL Y-17804) TaxID=698492 RepID=A0A0E9NAX3_SAICN|nr:hypothetical protein G7K_0790-t1 [Saitoella complicata NRRL Y-17804]